MVISPTYAGDGAYSTSVPSGGLDREASLLKEAMENRQISQNAEDQEKSKAIEELSKLLDVRAEDIESNMNVRMKTMADSMQQIVDALVSVADQFIAVGKRCEAIEIRLTLIETAMGSLATMFPSDVATGTTNVRPQGRNYQQVVPHSG